MAKTSNNNTLVRKSTKIPTAKKIPKNEDLKLSVWLEDYMDLFSFKLKPVTQGFIDRLAHELNEWSKQEDSLVLRDFYDSKDIPRDAFYRWIDKYPELQEAFKVAKGRISSRREKGGMTRKFDPSFIINSMPMYDSEWKEFVQWKSNLKSSEGSNDKIVIEINDLSKKSAISSGMDT